MTAMDTNPPGRGAASPWAIPAAGWKQVALRAWREAGQDNASLVASGVAFCGVLALVPMLGAVVLTYGLVASPATVIANMQALTKVMPADAARLIGEQLANVVQGSGGKKGIGLVLALAIALYGAMKGAGAMVTALNIAYDEEETRGFVRLNLLNLAITVSAVLLAILAVVAIAAVGWLEALFPALPGWALVLLKLLSYLVMTAAGAAAAAAMYRFGPDRKKARWTWLTPGSLFAALAWLVMTLGFGFYVANFGSYDATYGSLGAAIVLLTWLNLSAYVLMLGAELNCELERQTARDTTGGPERPLGERGAYAADTVAEEDAPAQHPAGPSAATPAPPPTAASTYLRAVLLTASGVALIARGRGLLGTLLLGMGVSAAPSASRPARPTRLS